LCESYAYKCFEYFLLTQDAPRLLQKLAKDWLCS
jgi:hypothetical protein